VDSRRTPPVVAAAVLIGMLAGCSSGPPAAEHEPGTLTTGTAHITVNGADLGQFHTVSCTPAGEQLTITTGNEDSGSTAVITNADGLAAKSVAINNLGGFTGSYHEGLDGKATVTIAGNTYSIVGSAEGFATDNPSFRAPGTFEITVAC